MTLSDYQRKSQFVGRDRELDVLRTALDAALNGRGRLVLIGGEAGIGKSTLARQVAEDAHLRSALVRWGHCFDLEVTPAFGPWREVLVGLPDADGNPSSMAMFDTAASSMSGPDELRVRIGRFLAKHAQTKPMVLVLEDLHWADQASIELLRYLARQVSEQALLLVVTYRDAELGPERVLDRFLPTLVREARPARIDLRPLSRSSVGDLVAIRYGLDETDQDRLVELLESNAEGNPFFIEELLHALEIEGIVRRRADGCSLGPITTLPMPTLVRHFVDERLKRATGPTIQALEAASIIGNDVPIDLWQSATDLSDEALNSAIREAISARILTEIGEAGSYRFRHALIRRSLYDGLPLPERREWHRKVGDVLSRRGQPDVEGVAYHLWQARDERAGAWLAQAGDQARHRSAPSTAIELYSRAFEMAANWSSTPLAAALNARGQAYATIGEFEHARTDFLAALEHARSVGDHETEWRTLIDLGVLWTERDYAQVVTYFSSALSLAESLDDSRLVARSLAWMGTWRLNVGDPVQAVAFHDRALSIHERLDDHHGIAATSAMLGMDNLIRGDLLQAHACGRRAERLFRAHGNERELANALIPLLSSGGVCSFATEVPAEPDSADFRGAGLEAVRSASATAWRAQEAFARNAYATFLVMRGEYGDALAHANVALEISCEIEHLEWATLAEIVLGEIYLDVLSLEVAVRHLTTALESASRIGSFIHARLAAGPLARAFTQSGALERAEAVLAPVLGAVSAARTSVERGCWRSQAELEIARGRGDRALSIVDMLIATTPNGLPDRVPPHLNLLHGQVLASMNRLDDACPLVERARYGAVRHGFRPLLWRCYELESEILQRLNRPAESRSANARKHEVIKQVAGTLQDSTLRDSLFHRASTMSATALPNRAEGLSKRELEVLRLAARGLTNAQIGEQLFISPRTVKGHLESIYGKLGVDTRTAAATFALENEII